MPLPPSFLKGGYSSAISAVRSGRRFRRLMIGCDGLPDTGKTEFSLSAPGPGLFLALDRGIDPCLDNPKPPAARNLDNFGVKVIKIALATQVTKEQYVENWKAFYGEYLAAIENPDARTIVIDGDSDNYELQKLAEFGRLEQIPPIMHTRLYAARRAMYSRAYDSGKIIIATYRLKEEYEDVVDEKGKPVIESSGKTKQRKTGEFVRQGFPDQNYLFNIQLRHMYRPARVQVIGKKEVDVPAEFGFRITKCKSDMTKVGLEIWGERANFRGLVEEVYPNVNPAEWGFPS